MTDLKEGANTMKLRMTDFTETHAKEICGWKYDGEYSIYNYPEWDKVCTEKWGIAIEEKRKNEFKAVIDDGNRLCGYIRLVNKNEHVLVGVGLKPSLCGQGLGKELMEMVKQQCKKAWPGRKIALEVRSFNKRAIKCYERAGFVQVDSYEKDTPIGFGEFARMETKFEKD